MPDYQDKQDLLNNLEALLDSGENCKDAAISELDQFLSPFSRSPQPKEITELKAQLRRIKQKRIDFPITTLFLRIDGLITRLNSPITISDYKQLEAEIILLIGTAITTLNNSARISEETKTAFTKRQQIIQNIIEQNELNQHNLNTLIKKTREQPTLNTRYERIQTQRELRFQNLSNDIQSNHNETIITLTEKAQECHNKIVIENARIRQLNDNPSHTLLSFVNALQQLQLKSTDLMQRGNGSEQSVERRAHEELEYLIRELAAAEQAYIITDDPDEVAILTFNETCNQLIANLNKAIISQPRGWSITRVLDNITTAIDALIDYLSQNEPNTTKIMYRFFHLPTTTEKQVDALKDTFQHLREPNRGLNNS
jgi:hypothetical protein